MAALTFGFVAGAVDRTGASDEELYEAMLADVEYHAGLGFQTVWAIEHHFSDYYPTPDPLLTLAHFAARFPRLDLGTAVLVTPWHNPLRMAEGIAMLSNLSQSRLHFGLGRGTAKFEYDAFGIPMPEARDRFRETLEVLRLALSGEEFTYDGQYARVPEPIHLRPKPRHEKLNLYGAIGSPGSAPLMAELGLGPICTSIGDFQVQHGVLDAWREAAQRVGLAIEGQVIPIMLNCIVAETDDEAIAQAREHMSRFMEAQVRHYATDTTDWASINGYEQWAKQLAGMKRMTVPENIDPWTRWQLIGSPATVAERVRSLADLGFNHFILQLATPGVPLELRKEWGARFAQEVIPQVRATQAPAGVA